MAGTWRLLIGQLRRATSRKGTSSSPPPPATASADLDEKPAASFLEPSGASAAVAAVAAAAAAAAEPAVCALSVPAIVLRAEQRVGEAEGEAQSSQTHATGLPLPQLLLPPLQLLVAAAAPAHPQKFPMAKYAASMRRAIIKLASRPFADSVGSLVPSYKRQPGAGAGSAAACCPEPQLSRAEVIGLLCKTVPRCNVVLPRSGFVFGVDLENLPPVVTSEVVFERGLRCRVPLIVERCARYILESG
ncbi:MAG: hypothetical protein BJ554DRAFT_2695 [Olpidium bornovanus]|uniref:Uncharacterized protein n=1 Tax=Olpidium bornovanus TaxID=278681 RepID=A0A8H7ZQI1_9FUNG|nr:MAG: hypothetical protein BJ554DRAFT_2695 [Olpidium bornovanus]